jgi:hypothetical protein
MQLKLGVVEYGCNLSTQEAEAEAGDCEFKGSLAYTVRPCVKMKRQKKKKKKRIQG